MLNVIQTRVRCAKAVKSDDRPLGSAESLALAEAVEGDARVLPVVFYDTVLRSERAHVL